MAIKSIFAIFIFSSMMFTGLANGQSAEQLYGRWKITSVVDAAPITAMSGAEANRLVGHFLVLTPHNFRFGKETCQPTYEISRETPVEFIQDNKLDPKTLSLQYPIVSFDIGCTFVYPRTSNEIILAWDGFFLAAKKIPDKKKNN